MGKAKIDFGKTMPKSAVAAPVRDASEEFSKKAFALNKSAVQGLEDLALARSRETGTKITQTDLFVEAINDLFNKYKCSAKAVARPRGRPY